MFLCSNKLKLRPTYPKSKNIPVIHLMEAIHNILPSVGSFLVPLWGDLINKNVITSNFSGIDMKWRKPSCHKGSRPLLPAFETSELNNDPHSTNKWGLGNISKSDKKIEVAVVTQSSTLPFVLWWSWWPRAQMVREGRGRPRVFVVFVNGVTALVTTEWESEGSQICDKWAKLSEPKSIKTNAKRTEGEKGKRTWRHHKVLVINSRGNHDVNRK